MTNAGQVKWMLHLPESGPLSFVTNITPGIIITSHAPVLTALWTNHPWKSLREYFLNKNHLEIQKLEKSKKRCIKYNISSPRYYTEDRDHEMDMWVVVGDTENKFLTLVVTPYKVSTSVQNIEFFQSSMTGVKTKKMPPPWVIVKLKALTTINNQNPFNINCVLILQCSECCFLLVSTTIIKC